MVGSCVVYCLCISSFYRYVLSPEIQFNPVTHMSVGPAAVFQDLPQKPILTLTLDAPESWLVESVKTTYDLDNIHLEEVRVYMYGFED